jgi:hypothetical protein
VPPYSHSKTFNDSSGPSGPPFAVARKDKVARSKLGPIPDDYFENDPIYPPPKKVLPLSKAELEWMKRLKDTGSDKYKPGDYVGGY